MVTRRAFIGLRSGNGAGGTGADECESTTGVRTVCRLRASHFRYEVSHLQALFPIMGVVIIGLMILRAMILGLSVIV